MSQPALSPLALLCTAVLLSAWLCSTQAMAQQTVRVGVYANAPKLLMDEAGHVSGIHGEMLQAIARREGWTLQAVPCQWQQCLQMTEAGEIDLMPDVALNEARALVLDFHRIPALFSWSQLYSHDSLQLASMLDLAGKRIAVLDGSVQEEYLANQLDSFGIKAQLVSVATMEQGFALVADQHADAVVTNQRFGDYQAPRYGLRDTPIMFQPAKLFFATRKGANAALLAAIDHHLQSWQDNHDSVYYQILRRWGADTPRRFIPVAFWWGLGLLAVLLLAALGGAMLLRRQVADKTRHIKASETRLNTILDSVEAFIYIKDPHLRYQYANRKVCELFGRPLEQVIGQTDAAFFDALTVATLEHNDRRVLQQGERVETEEVNRSAHDDHEHTYLSVKLPLRAQDGSIYALCGISTDITEHKKNIEQIHRLAFYDSLTNLPNRRLLIERLQHALAQRARNRQEGALLFIDLDNFKDLNDTLGHDMGDLLLQQVAQRLSDLVREEDTLARLGGDEFVLMLEGLEPDHTTSLGQIERVARKILLALSQPYELPGHSHSGSASIGVALFSHPHSTVEELLKRADLAMYEAKAGGRNTLRFFDPAMQAQVTARAALESDLRQSLKSDQFVLHYQPQVNQHGHLIGAEALVRWLHPQRGLVAPGEFIPVAESSGLIMPLGNWILQEACRQLLEWASIPALADINLAINVSARQFHHADFVDDVLAALRASGANPQRLELELTESHLVEDVEAMIAKMNLLKVHGVRFSLDDFGTGYSSLSYLKRLPLNNLKIDRSFVHDLLNDPNDAAIVRTIVALGNSLELAVIAEGVETPEQRDALLHLGCQQFQGYLYGKPGPMADLTQVPGQPRHRFA